MHRTIRLTDYIGWTNGLSRSNNGPVALRTLGLGLLNPAPLNGR